MTSPSLPSDGSLHIRNVTVIDGTGAPPVPDASIVIQSGEITYVGPEPPDVHRRVIDGAGLWAVPGLIDTHIHLELVGREALPVFLANGVTTVRDLGGPLDFLVDTRKQLKEGLVGPRLLFTGPMIDGEEPTWPALVRTTKDADSAVAAIDEHLEAGADAIKLYTTMQADVLRRCIEHVAGRVPVTGHLSRTPASAAMAAGINGLEHALLSPYNDFAPEGQRTEDETMMSPGFWGKVLRGWMEADLESPAADAWFEALVKNDVSFCPTLTVLPGAGDEPEEDEMRHLPQVRERWLESREQRRSQAEGPQLRDLAHEVRAKLQSLVLKTHRAGGRITAGTDTGAVRSLVPGFSLHKELEFLAGSGLSNMDVIRCATAQAARAIGRMDLGTIAAGQQADLLLLRSNPLLEIGSLRDLAHVIRAGDVHAPSDLLR